MVQDTKTKGQRIEGIDQLIAQELVQKMGQEEIVLEPGIDASNYQEVNMSYVMVAKTITKLFKDDELLNLFNVKNDPIRTLKALVAADIFLEGNTNQQAKDMIYQAAREGNAQDILNVVTAENKGMLSDAQVEQFMKARIPQLIVKEANKEVTQKYNIESLEGKLGKGMRISSKDRHFEQWDTKEGYTLRIIRSPQGFKTTLHAKKINGDNFYKGFSDLLNVVNSVFDSNLDISVEDFAERAGKQRDRYYDRFSSTLSGKNVSITYNKEDYFLSKCETLKDKVNTNGFDELSGIIGGTVAGCVVFCALGSGLLSNEPSAFPVAAYALGGTVLSFSPLLTDKWMGESWTSKALGKIQLEKYRRNYFSGTRSLERLAESERDYAQSLSRLNNADKISKLREKREQRLLELDETFDKISHAKGYALEYTTSSLEEAYEKAYQITELLNKQ